MRYLDSIFVGLLKPIDRRRFRAIVEEHKGDAYDKSFKSWDHLVVLIFAQLSHTASLRGIEQAFNANAHQHYHLNVGKIARATLSDGNARRPVEVFAQVFAMLSDMVDRQTRHEGAAVVELIDASPLPLGKNCPWATWNGRIRGMKMHVVYNPKADCPRRIEITAATVNDVEIGRQVPIEAGTTYVYDKGFYHFGWWKQIHEASAFFVTRPKTNTRWRVRRRRFVRKPGRRRFPDHRRRRRRPRQQGQFPPADPAAAHPRQARPGRHSSPSSPTISSARRSRSPPSTRRAGRSSCCSAGSSSTSPSASSSATTRTPSACRSWRR